MIPAPPRPRPVPSYAVRRYLRSVARRGGRHAIAHGVSRGKSARPAAQPRQGRHTALRTRRAAGVAARVCIDHVTYPSYTRVCVPPSTGKHCRGRADNRGVPAGRHGR